MLETRTVKPGENGEVNGWPYGLYFFILLLLGLGLGLAMKKNAIL